MTNKIKTAFHSCGNVATLLIEKGCGNLTFEKLPPPPWALYRVSARKEEKSCTEKHFCRLHKIFYFLVPFSANNPMWREWAVYFQTAWLTLQQQRVGKCFVSFMSSWERTCYCPVSTTNLNSKNCWPIAKSLQSGSCWALLKETCPSLLFCSFSPQILAADGLLLHTIIKAVQKESVK